MLTISGFLHYSLLSFWDYYLELFTMKPMKIQNTDSTWFTETADNIGTAFSLATTTLLHQEKSAYQNIMFIEASALLIHETKTVVCIMVLT